MDWKRKLSSRKFWAMAADFVAMLIIALGYAQDAATKIAALLLAGGGIIAYILGESKIDATNVEPVVLAGVPEDDEGEEDD